MSDSNRHMDYGVECRDTRVNVDGNIKIGGESFRQYLTVFQGNYETDHTKPYKPYIGLGFRLGSLAVDVDYTGLCEVRFWNGEHDEPEILYRGPVK